MVLTKLAFHRYLKNAIISKLSAIVYTSGFFSRPFNFSIDLYGDDVILICHSSVSLSLEEIAHILNLIANVSYYKLNSS